MNEFKVKSVPCLICVAENDIDYLFKYTVLSCIKFIKWLKEFYIVTPAPNKVYEQINSLIDNCSIPVRVIHDDEVLTTAEQKLCGWSKQQIIKLKSDIICNSEYVFVVGADTIIIKPIVLSDLMNQDQAIILFRKHASENKHYLFEVERVRNICKILGIESDDRTKPVDFIFDVFLFQRKILVKLRNKLIQKFGENSFLKVFPKKVNGYQDMVQTGEWTLYSLFIIHLSGMKYELKCGNYLSNQIHTQREFNTIEFTAKSIHFVRKDFNKVQLNNIIKEIIML